MVERLVGGRLDPGRLLIATQQNAKCIRTRRAQVVLGTEVTHWRAQGGHLGEVVVDAPEAHGSSCVEDGFEDGGAVLRVTLRAWRSYVWRRTSMVDYSKSRFLALSGGSS